MKTQHIIGLLLIACSHSLTAQVFQSLPLTITNNPSSRYTWVDIDGDGDVDVLEFGLGPEAVLHVRNGDLFTSSTISLTETSLADDNYFKLSDYDHDSDLDLLIVRPNNVAIATNTGNNFTAVNTNITFTNNENGPLNWLDVDGDLDFDIVHAGRIYVNNNGSYAESVFALATDIRNIVWGDINNDGLVDILATTGYDEWSGNPLQVFVNKGDGDFQPIENMPVMNVRDGEAMLLFDADSDGLLDIFASNDIDGKSFVLKNTTTNGQVQFATPYSLGNISASQARAGDLDFDGFSDLVIAGYSYQEGQYQVMVFKNTTSGPTPSFLKTTSFEATEVITALHLTDYDGDDDLDIHMKVYYRDYFMASNTILLNTSDAGSPLPSVPKNLITTITTGVKFSWSGSLHASYNIELKRNGQVIRINPTTSLGKLLLADNSALISSPTFTAYNLPSGSYEWRVQSIDKSRRASPFSSANTFEINAGPSGLKLQVLGMTSVKLCWNYTGSGNPSFMIFRRAETSNLKMIATVPAGVLCYTDNGLTKNTRYEYFIKAIVAGINSPPSESVNYFSSLFNPVSFGTISPIIISATCQPADYDQDGDYDLEFIGRIGFITGRSDLLYLNDGTGNYPDPSSMLPTLSYEFQIQKVVDYRDMDNDGDIDICAILGTDYSWGKVAVLLNENGKLKLGFQTNAYLSLYQAAVTDFNSDGRLDILYRHALGNGVGNPSIYELLLQTQDGDFVVNKFRFTEGDYGELGSFLVADINGDGFTDICFTGTEYEPAHFFVNDGGMTFHKYTPSPALEFSPFSFLDVDGDGVMDVIGSSNDGIKWFKGSNNFQFTDQQVLHHSSSINRPFAKMADLDLDGLPDIIVTDGYQSSVAINKGSGDFEVASVELDPHWGSSFGLTDAENDGDLDIVKLGNDDAHQGYNYFYLNQSNMFGATNARPAVPTSLTAAFSYGNMDISWQSSTDDKTPANQISYNLWINDSNGKAWLHGESDATGLFRRRLTTGNAGFRTHYTIRDLPEGTYKIRVQAIDAALASSPWSSEISVTVAPGPTNLKVERILLNKVKLVWIGSTFNDQHVIVERKSVESAYEVIAELPAGATSFIDENLNYNKNYEYRVIEVNNDITTAHSNVTGWSTVMWIVKETTLPNIGGSVDIGDYTQDGKMDIALSGGRIYNSQYVDLTCATFENNDGSWIRHDITVATAPQVSTLKFFDYNADHRLDLYQHGYSWGLGFKTEVYRNNGDKTLTSETNLFTQNTYDIQSEYDIDMDNDMDLLVEGGDNSDQRVLRILKNNGNANYAVAPTNDPSCSSCYAAAASADFDGDGDEDLIHYDGDSFLLYPEAHFPSRQNQIGILDYNGDGLTDIALLTASYTLGKLYKNQGLKDGALQFKVVLDNLPTGTTGFNVADFDNDGKQDFALISPQASMYRNTGNDTFELYQIPYYKFSSARSQTMIDFDNDGDLDIYISEYHILDQYDGYDRPFSKILINQIIDAGKGTENTAPPAPTNLSAFQDSLGMNFTWSDGVDDHTPKSALTHDVILYRDGTAILKASIDPVTGARQRIDRGVFTNKAILNNLHIGKYTWKVQAVDQSYLGSPLSVEGAFTFLPPPPIANDTLIYRCGRTVTITAIGNDVRWYSDRTLTKLLATGEFHPEESQIAYVTQKIEGYEGIPRRVSITINETPPAPLTETTVHYCENPNPYYYYLSATGTEIHWYADAQKNQLLNSDMGTLSVAAKDATYYVTQTKQSCESKPIEVTVSKITIDTKIYGLPNALVVGDQTADYYEWYKDGYYIYNSNSFSIPYHGETATYRVFVKKGVCSEYSGIYNMPADLVTGIEDELDATWAIYPNPSVGSFAIDSKVPLGDFKIYDITGRLVYTHSGKHSEAMNEPHVVRLPKGVYMVMVTLEGIDAVSTKRVVVH